jgi:hypothetical protein
MKTRTAYVVVAVIAVAIGIGVGVYLWWYSYSSKISIESVTVIIKRDWVEKGACKAIVDVVAYVRNVGVDDVVITQAYITDVAGRIIVLNNSVWLYIPRGHIGSVVVKNVELVAGTTERGNVISIRQYRVHVVTSRGTEDKYPFYVNADCLLHI